MTNRLSSDYAKYLIYCILLTINLLFSTANSNASELIFRVYEPDYHIDGKKITAVCEDPHAFMIIGVRGGLYRFDGLQYNALPYPDSLRTHAVTEIYCFDTRVFVGLSNGVVLQYNHLNQLPKVLFHAHAEITAIVHDLFGRTWASTYGNGLFVLNDSLRQFTVEDGLSDNFVYALQADSTGVIWAGTDAGLVSCDFQNTNQAVVFESFKSQLPDLIIHSLCLDKQNTLWIGFNEAGVYQYNLTSHVFNAVVSGQDIGNSTIASMSVMEDYLWIASESEGLFAFNTSNGLLRNYSANKANPLPPRILGLSPSLLGGFWIAGEDKLIWTPGRTVETVTEANGKPLGEVYALLADSQNNLWFCSENGLYRKKLNTKPDTSPERMLTNRIFDKYFYTTLYEDTEGFIWIGTFDHGVLQLNPKNLSVKIYNENTGLANNNVLNIAGSGDTLWFSTFGGVSRLIKTPGSVAVFESFNNESSMSNKYIYQIHITPHGRVWFATDGNGLTYYDKGVFKHLNDSVLKGKAVYSLIESADSALWLALADEGLLRLKGDSLRHFGLNDGLGSLTVTSLISLGSHYLLVVNTHRVDLIDTDNGEVIQVGENFDLHEIKAGLNAFTKNKKSEYWIGTQNGYIKLNQPEQLARIRPVLNLNNVLVNLESIDTMAVQQFSYNENYLLFEYTGIWYPRPGDVRFKVKLEGQDKDWSITRDHQLSYSNLSAGDYRFVLLDASNTGSKARQLVYRFSISKPFWFQWWFLFVLALLLSSLLWWVIRWRVMKLKREQLFRNEKLESEYQNLRNQVNPHFLFNSFSTLIALIETEPRTAVDYVEKLSDYFRSILQYRDTELIPLSEELILLETYIFLQKKRYVSGLRFSVTLTEIQKQCSIPPMTLQMLAENALKHNVVSKQKPLHLVLEYQNDTLVMLNNLQAKKQPEISTSLGLKNISERYRLFAGKQVEVVNTGTQFIVKLPVIPLRKMGQTIEKN